MVYYLGFLGAWIKYPSFHGIWVYALCYFSFYYIVLVEVEDLWRRANLLNSIDYHGVGWRA